MHLDLCKIYTFRENTLDVSNNSLLQVFYGQEMLSISIAINGIRLLHVCYVGFLFTLAQHARVCR